MTALRDVTVIVVNYRTLSHTRTCLSTLRSAYPDVSVLVVDNGSKDESTDYLVDLAQRDPNAAVVVNDRNVFHGPALDQSMRLTSTRFAFLLDSDCIIRRGGFLEPLVERFERVPELYAVGKRGWTGRRGYAPISDRQRHTAYVHPFAGLFDRDKYLGLPPFVHHGAPLYRNMWGARAAGYRLEHVDIEDYVEHLGKVTASTHGYGYDRRLLLQWRVGRLEDRVRRAAAVVTRRPLVPPTLPTEGSAPLGPPGNDL